MYFTIIKTKKLQIQCKQNYNQNFKINDIKEQIVIKLKLPKLDILVERCVGTTVLLMIVFSLFQSLPTIWIVVIFIIIILSFLQ